MYVTFRKQLRGSGGCLVYCAQRSADSFHTAAPLAHFYRTVVDVITVQMRPATLAPPPELVASANRDPAKLGPDASSVSASACATTLRRAKRTEKDLLDDVIFVGESAGKLLPNDPTKVLFVIRQSLCKLLRREERVTNAVRKLA